MTTQAEIQEDLLRFSGDLVAGLTDAAEVLVRERPSEPREVVLRQLLRYESSALEIATNSMPEVGLCDMVVFVGLCRGVFERHWLGVFGDGARPLLAVWTDAEDRIRTLSLTTMTDTQWRRLRALIDDWLRENPDRVAVEEVRFAELSTLVGKVAAVREDEAKGLFGSVKSATTAADQALLVADRALFMVSRFPFVLRLHARLAAFELVSDGKVQLHATEQLRGILGHELDRFVRRWVLYLVALGAAWSVLLWAGYVVAMRLARH
jgi:hypothetical protein